MILLRKERISSLAICIRFGKNYLQPGISLILSVLVRVNVGSGRLIIVVYSGKNVEFLESKIDSLYRLYPADIVLLHAGHNHFAEEKPYSRE